MLFAADSTAPLALLGGTFDPVHWGHLRIASETAAALKLPEVRLIPSKAPVHRTTPGATSRQRLNHVVVKGKRGSILGCSLMIEFDGHVLLLVVEQDQSSDRAGQSDRVLSVGWLLPKTQRSACPGRESDRTGRHRTGRAGVQVVSGVQSTSP